MIAPSRFFPRSPASLPMMLIAATLAVAPVFGATAAEAPRLLTISGTGKATGRPDVAWIELGVATEAATAAEALTANSRSMEAILTALDEMAIDRNNVQTSQFSVEPVYSHLDQPADVPVIRGYRVANQVTVKIHELDRIGLLLDRVVKLGSNRLNNIRFDIDEPEALLDQARQKAVANALHKAKVYVGAAGMALGRIMSISENGTSRPEPVYARTMAMEGGASVPIAPGEQTLTAGVTLTIEIE